MFFLYATFETNSVLYWRLREFQDGGITVLWALFAIGFITGGIWKNIRPLRFIGLTLFGIVALKILVDVWSMDVLYRIIACLAVGATLLLGSFAYIYANREFIHEENDAREES
jgi:uncharacterized membrane protein